MARDPAHRVERGEPHFDVFGEDALAVHAQAEARGRDADLCRGDVAIEPPRVGQDARDARRQASALRGLVLDVGARGADDGELGGHEQPVGHGERRDDGKRHQELVHASAPWSSVGAIRVATTESTARSVTRSTRKE